MRPVKKPEAGVMGPIWWHHHGMKMTLKELDIRNKFAVIGSRLAARLTIKSRAIGTDEGWRVIWWIKFSRDCDVTGETDMSTHDLRCAFGLTNEEEDYGKYSFLTDWIINRFGADCAIQGQFIRFAGFLNIPGPGTGSDGDPNISILLDREIKEAINKLTS